MTQRDSRPHSAALASTSVRLNRVRGISKRTARRRLARVASHRRLAARICHMAHLVPGHAILAIGFNEAFLRALQRATRRQNPVTVATLPQNADTAPHAGPDGVACSRRLFDLVLLGPGVSGHDLPMFVEQAVERLRPGATFLAFCARRTKSCINAIRQQGMVDIDAAPTASNNFLPSRRWPRLGDVVSLILEQAPGLRRCTPHVIVHARKPAGSSAIPVRRHVAPPALHKAVSVVIPCRNEEANIGRLIHLLRAMYADYLREIIPVDDGSHDGTRAAIRRMAADDSLVRPVFRDGPCGVGRALRDGIAAAAGDWVLLMDCDFSCLAPRLAALFDQAAAGNPVVVGSRFSRETVLIRYPWQKLIANRLYHLLAHVALRSRCWDLTNNLKLIRRDILQQLPLLQPGFAVNAETGILPQLLGIPIVEVPVSWINRTTDEGSSSFRLTRVGGGYWRVVWHVWLRQAWNAGPYRRAGNADPDWITPKQDLLQSKRFEVGEPS